MRQRVFFDHYVIICTLSVAVSFSRILRSKTSRELSNDKFNYSLTVNILAPSPDVIADWLKCAAEDAECGNGGIGEEGLDAADRNRILGGLCLVSRNTVYGFAGHACREYPVRL